MTGGIGIMFTVPRRNALSNGLGARFKTVERRELPFQVIYNGDKVRIDVDFATVFPCSGYMNEFGRAYIMAPALKLDLEHHRDLSFMILEPDTRSITLTPVKTTLSATFKDAAASATMMEESRESRQTSRVQGQGSNGRDSRRSGPFRERSWAEGSASTNILSLALG